MSWSSDANGQLDLTHKWNWTSETDRESYMRAFSVGTSEDKRMAVALMCASPLTPNSQIRSQLRNAYIPPRQGYDRDEPDIDVVLGLSEDSQSLASHSMMNFSGTEAGMESSSRNSMGSW